MEPVLFFGMTGMCIAQRVRVVSSTMDRSAMLRKITPRLLSWIEKKVVILQNNLRQHSNLVAEAVSA